MGAPDTVKESLWEAWPEVATEEGVLAEAFKENWGDAYVIRVVEAAPEATRTHTLRGLPASPPGTHSLACTLAAMITLTLFLRRIRLPSPLGETMTLTPTLTLT